MFEPKFLDCSDDFLFEVVQNLGDDFNKEIALSIECLNLQISIDILCVKERYNNYVNLGTY